MTEEQVADLWLQYCHYHPERVKKADSTFEDPEFEAFEKELAEESAGILYPGTRIIPHGQPAPVFVSEAPLPPAADWEDVPFDEE